MNRLTSNALIGFALLNSAWRWLEGRQTPLRVGGRIATWAYADGRRDDAYNLERVLLHGSVCLSPGRTFVVRRSVRLR